VTRWLPLAALVLLPAGEKAEAPALTKEYHDPTGAFSFRTPEVWRVGPLADRPDVLEAAGGGLRVRFVHRKGEVAYDALHAHCMLERLAGLMDASPDVRYEYDFVSWTVGERRALDSAFTVRYDAPIDGQHVWRQRNVTVVGGGQSLCVIAHAPAPLWKKSRAARQTLDAVVSSVQLK
jgi:hypothetical protein